ncbi:polysaccharide pyruvyl transferase family protein [[Eubacterium] cellulosolvens]
MSSALPSVLLMGYNGANNTGSESRLLSIIDDVRAVLGPKAHITVPSLNPPNLRRYLKEGPYIRIAPVPSIYFFALRRLVKEHDIILLVEGSCYMDTWTSALLWAFLWTSKYACKYNKPSLAYAVDTGDLKPSNCQRVQREASRTNLIICRTQAAADRLKSLGVTAPIEVTADTAFTYSMNTADDGILNRRWPTSKSGVVGISVVDFYIWPVVVRLWGKKEHCYKWPYYFSRSTDRRAASAELATGWAAEADRIIEKFNKSIALICMEELDGPLAYDVHKKMRHSKRARVFSSKEYNASQMTAILRRLDLLITSRYHAGVLSLAAQIPQIAVGHDKRLRTFYQELGIFDNYFVAHDSPDLWKAVRVRVDALLENPKQVQSKLSNGYQEHLARAKRNRELLRCFLEENGWGVRT